MYSYANRFCDGFSAIGRYPLGGSILFLLGIILIAVLVFAVLRKGGVVRKTDSESPLELLQKRFVNGEISQEEYLEKKDVLKG
jgi:uncharacterized membrane protein